MNKTISKSTRRHQLLLLPLNLLKIMISMRQMTIPWTTLKPRRRTNQFKMRVYPIKRMMFKLLMFKEIQMKLW